MPFWEWGGVIATRPHNDATSEHSLQSSLVVGGGGVTLQSEMLPPSEISEQIADYQADIWSNIRFQISDARCRCHNLSLDPDFRFQISDFWAKIYPRTRFLVRFQISDFTCPDQAPSHGPPTSFAGWRITRQSAICNLLEHNAKRKQPGRFRSQFASSRCPWAVLLTSEEHT